MSTLGERLRALMAAPDDYGRGYWVPLCEHLELATAYVAGDVFPEVRDAVDADGADVTLVWLPGHDISIGSGGCWHCGLIPLDWDAVETLCK